MSTGTSESQIKIEQIKFDNELKKRGFTRTLKEQQITTDFFRLFNQDKDNRDTFVKRHFNGRMIEEYLDDGQKQVNGHIEPRTDDPDDWQTKYESLLTRNKMIVFLAKTAIFSSKMKFSSKDGGGDSKQLKVFNAKFKDSQTKDKWQLKNFQQRWYKWVNGTVVVWDRPQKETKKINKIIDYDPETGKSETIKQIIQRFTHVSQIIPLQDIWFGNLRETDIQKQDHIWLRFEPNYQDFIKDYGKLKNANFVQPVKSDSSDVTELFYRKNDIEKDKVEIMIYLNIWEDRMIIWANKLIIYDGILPFGDDDEGREYPLSIGINEYIQPDFVYGKSGADNLRGDQAMVSLFLRKLADRSILETNPPIFSEGNPDLPEEIKARPGFNYEVENLSGIREFVYSKQTNDIVGVLKVFEDQANKTSISDASAGTAQPNRTATADNIAEQATNQIAGLTRLIDLDFDKQKADIRAKHILQFIDIPEKTILEGDEEPRLEFGVFVDKNVILDDGSRGDIIYQIVSSSNDLPSEETIDIKEALAKAQDYNVQYKFITPDFFEGLMVISEPEAISEAEMSPALKKGVEVEFQKGFATFFPELFQANKQEFAKDYIEAYEKDLDRLIGQENQPEQLPANIGAIQPGGIPNKSINERSLNIPQEVKQLQNV